MMSAGRYLLLTATRARAPLLALAATLFAVVGTFYQPYNQVGSSWALTSLMAAGLAAWLTLTVLSAEPAAQAEIATAALGGQGRRLRVSATLALSLAAGLTVLFIAFPLLLQLVVRPPVFDRPVQMLDIVAALITNFTGAAVGAAIGVLCAPPRILRPAASAAAALGGLLTLVVFAAPLGKLGGPLAAAAANSDAPAGDLTGSELIGWTSSALLCAATILAAAAADRFRG